MSTNNEINFVKGDTHKLGIKVYTPKGNLYQIQDGTKIYLTVKNYPGMHPKIRLSLDEGITVDNNIIAVTFKPTDTDHLDVNYEYRYDVEIVVSENEKYTVIADAPFRLTPEYTTTAEEGVEE